MTIRPISTNTTNPSFTAKLRYNTDTADIISNMNKKQLGEFKSTLQALDKVEKGEVIEYKKFYSPVPYSKASLSMGFVNEKDETKNVKTPWFPSPSEFIKTLKNIANPKTEEHEKIFGNKKELQNEVISMLEGGVSKINKKV